MKRAMLCLSLVFMVSMPASATTWYVNTSGTGDAPTIQAAMDSSASGDTVLVAAGNYEVANVSMWRNVVLTSESGPYSTRLFAGSQDYHPALYAISCALPPGHGYAEISGFWFEGYSHDQLGAIVAGDNPGVYVRNCIFTGNRNAILAATFAWVHIDNCTFFNNTYGLIYESGARIYLSYSILWDHIDGPSGYVMSDGVSYLSFEDLLLAPAAHFVLEDPQFCGLGDGNVYLQSDSPCAPGNHPWDASDMRVMGALPVGCSTVNTEARSWGEVKALYRGGSPSE